MAERADHAAEDTAQQPEGHGSGSGARAHEVAFAAGAEHSAEDAPTEQPGQRAASGVGRTAGADLDA